LVNERERDFWAAGSFPDDIVGHGGLDRGHSIYEMEFSQDITRGTRQT
jgi:hypothetical protein